VLAVLARCRSFRGPVVVPALSIAYAWGMRQALVGREPFDVGQEAAMNAVTTWGVGKRFYGCRRTCNRSLCLAVLVPVLAPTHDLHLSTAALTSTTPLPHSIKMRFATVSLCWSGVCGGQVFVVVRCLWWSGVCGGRTFAVAMR